MDQQQIDSLKEFAAPFGNTCAISGKVFLVGDRVYATSVERLWAGDAICEAEYKRLTAPKSEPAKTEPPKGGDKK